MPAQAPSWEELAEGYEGTLLLQALVVMAREYGWYVRHATLRQAAAVALGVAIAYAVMFATAAWAGV